MIRGVKFEIPQEVTNTLLKILNVIDIEQYDFYISEEQQEVWNEKRNGEFFDTWHYNGKAFIEKIKEPHYIIFLKAQAYFNAGKYKNIQNYDEFLKSNCQIIVLIYDCEFAEIYCKDEKTANMLYNNAINNNFKNIELISNENDQRVSMDI